ncbi:M23 family peptidase [Lelliottia amnigena]|uniref:M23 family peptidase n=1 Tax=Lelliottia amnigena TaxID=61646 RepID=UPI001957637C|nr:M23 family peptidase [Lelliottia amnigena]MBM7356688.1 murein DD-endopeptidase MepM/ murein hydrolase activator NlpD [Lelliottia amnigena]WSO18957.1 M23 family peptidase [Lelliottia amnigena]
MIISPPFLKPRHQHETDDRWIDRTQNTDPVRAYPLNRHQAWHGGIHLKHTDSTSQPEFVRAIADGTVVSVRNSRLEKRDTFPQNNTGGKYGTDNGYILLRHETETGTGDNAKVVFYSLYMHMTQLRPEMVKGKKVYRKDKLGSTGMVDGDNAFHFQIFCDDASIQRLTGRTDSQLDTSQDGRTDAIYGDMHFYLPAGTEVWQSEPGMMEKSPRSTAVKTTLPLYVTRELKQGNQTVITRAESAPGSGEFNAVGDPLVSGKYEYELYSKIHAHAKGHNQSAIYELHRFGRLVSPDQEQLTDPATPVWCQVNHLQGTGWVNLADPKIKKFSDADFPHWTGWRLVDDDTDTNSQCNSPTVLAEKDAGQPLSRLICHFPFEWDRSTITSRFQWLTSPNEHVDPPMTADDFTRFQVHVTALCLDDALPGGRYWHFHPLEFIKHFRKCLWMSASEFKQVVPVYAIRSDSHRVYREKVTLHDGADSVFMKHYTGLNRAMRKYGINTPWRMACFLGNAVQESAWLNQTSEGYVNTFTDPATHEKKKRNTWYYPWYGRGFLQLTSPNNYFDYWTFRGREYPASLKETLSDAYHDLYQHKEKRYHNTSLLDEKNPDLTINVLAWRDDVANHSYDPSDSAGYYWILTNMAGFADEDHILEKHSISGISCYRSNVFWKASAIVNAPAQVTDREYRGLNGFDSRCCAYGYALDVLSETRFSDSNGSSSLEFPYTHRRG